MGNLEHDTTPSGAEGRYTIAISEDWRIWGPNVPGEFPEDLALQAAARNPTARRQRLNPPSLKTVIICMTGFPRFIVA